MLPAEDDGFLMIGLSTQTCPGWGDALPELRRGVLGDPSAAAAAAAAVGDAVAPGEAAAWRMSAAGYIINGSSPFACRAC
jgi:hypothetical protein